MSKALQDSNLKIAQVQKAMLEERKGYEKAGELMTKRIIELQAGNLFRLGRIKELQKTNMEMEEGIKTLLSMKEEKMKLQEDIKKLLNVKEEKMELEKYITKLQAELQKEKMEMENKIKKLEDNLSGIQGSMKEERMQLEGEITKIQAELQTERMDMENQIKKLEDDLSNMQEAMELIATEKTELQLEHKGCGRKISEMMCIIKRLKEEINMKDDHNATLLKNSDEQGQQQLGLREQLKAQKERENILETRLYDSTTREGTMQIELQAVQENIQALRETIQIQRVEIGQLQVNKQRATWLEERLAESEMQQGVLQSQIQSIGEENEGLKEIMRIQKQQIEKLQNEKQAWQDLADSNAAHKVSQEMEEKLLKQQEATVKRNLRPRKNQKTLNTQSKGM